MIKSIEENQSLEIKNVLHFREKLNPQTSATITKQMDDLMRKYNASKSGSVITVTYAVTIENGQQTMDIEMFVPLDKEIEVQNPFDFIPVFHLSNALKVQITGNPQQLETAIKTLSEYIKTNQLTPITSAYVVTIKEARTQQELDEMITEVWVGVK